MLCAPNIVQTEIFLFDFFLSAANILQVAIRNFCETEEISDRPFFIFVQGVRLKGRELAFPENFKSPFCFIAVEGGKVVKINWPVVGSERSSGHEEQCF